MREASAGRVASVPSIVSCLTIYGSSLQRLIRNKPKLRPDMKWSGRDTPQCERIGRCFQALGVSLAGYGFFFAGLSSKSW